MNQTLANIHKYLISKGAEEKNLSKLDRESVYLSMEIMEYAHRNQHMENGEDYAEHPSRCLERYRKLVGIIPSDPFCMDKEYMREHGIPFDGVSELCLLHDVLGKTDLSFDDVQNVFYACGFKAYFNLYLKDPLKRITQSEITSYDDYIQIVLQNPVSAIVKMIELQDNLEVLDRVELNECTLKRSMEDIRYIHIINDVYHFVENARAYLKEYKGVAC